MDIEKRLADLAGDEYSYRELDDFTDSIAKRLRGVASVSKVTRAGVVGERVYLDYSQERFAALGVGQSQLKDAIGARNIQVPGGVVEAAGRNLTIDPLRRLQEREGDRRYRPYDLDVGCTGLRTGRGRCLSRLREPAGVPQFLHVARRRGFVPDDPRDHARCPNADRREDRPLLR